MPRPGAKAGRRRAREIQTSSIWLARALAPKRLARPDASCAATRDAAGGGGSLLRGPAHASLGATRRARKTRPESAALTKARSSIRRVAERIPGGASCLDAPKAVVPVSDGSGLAPGGAVRGYELKPEARTMAAAFSAGGVGTEDSPERSAAPSAVAVGAAAGERSFKSSASGWSMRSATSSASETSPTAVLSEAWVSWRVWVHGCSKKASSRLPAEVCATTRELSPATTWVEAERTRSTDAPCSLAHPSELEAEHTLDWSSARPKVARRYALEPGATSDSPRDKTPPGSNGAGAALP
mmetsp:Transcript_32003/g.102077  ORF Transcript_32003/g.102077 Transcript_32003/m.102077 type:complete len:298 (-) Transcript_32003:633-1526(-)